MSSVIPSKYLPLVTYNTTYISNYKSYRLISNIIILINRYYLRSWDKFQLAISLPSVIFLSYYYLLPESPRWLLAAGRPEDATKILEAAALRSIS